MDIAYELFKIRRSRFGDYCLCTILSWVAAVVGMFVASFLGAYLGAA